MENEVKEVLVEGQEGIMMPSETNQKSSKGVLLGIATVAAVLLFKFRKKIGTKIENSMVKKLGKKGYSVISPSEIAELSDEVLIDNID